MSPLSSDERRRLLEIARSSIVAAVSHRANLELGPMVGALAEPRGAFVTLRSGGKLRGCVGQPESRDPLAETVARCAALAALEDDRFQPVVSAEIAGLEIEVSVLSSPQPILPQQIEIGRHGLFIACGRSRGLLLPQVAVEHRLSTEQFLAETCRKAGLPRDAWKLPSAQILGFTAEIFGESNAGSFGESAHHPTADSSSK